MTALPADLTVPLRECLPWCEDQGDRHAGEHPEDRSCWSEYNVVKLSKHEPIDMGAGEWWQSFLNVYLERHPEDVSPVVYIRSEATGTKLVLTLAEVSEFVSILQRLLETAEAKP